MRAASSPGSSYSRQETLRRRVAGFLLALLAQALILLMLLRLSPETFGLPRPDRPLVTIDLLPGPQAASTAKKAATEPKQASAASAAAKAAVKPAEVLPPLPPLPPRPLNMVILPRDVLAAGDIAALPSRRGDRTADSGAAAGASAGNGADSALAAGSGPGGEKLYKAEWYREPTHAELAFYVKNGAPQGAWAVIACRTVAGFRVEDCAQLGDSPPGSGLARSIVQAAWQFRVKPPRVGGHSLVGAWVSIRIDFTVRGEGG